LNTRPERISESLEALLRRLDPGGTWILFRLVKAWPEIVGEAIARRTEVVALKGQTAVIKVSSALWIQELGALKGSILQKLKEKLPDVAVSDLHFVYGRLKRKPSRLQRMPPRELRVAITGIELKDPQLQQAFDRLIERWGRAPR